MITHVMAPQTLHDQQRDFKERNGAGMVGVRQPGVLVVDDDLAMRTLLNIVLQEHGFAVWLTSNGYEALRAYWGHGDDIDLVLLDVRMPGLDGPETLAALHEMNPRLPCCYMTGDPGWYTEEELMEQGAEHILYKPFRLAEVAQILRQLVSDSTASTLVGQS